MKALSVCQPWAQLLVLGAKRFETRSWQTKHRGTILVHASRKFTEAMRDLCTIEPFHSILKAANFKSPSDLPLGAFVGTVEIADCLDTDQVNNTLSTQERAFGDFRPGRWAWLCENPTPLVIPIVATGKLGLFDVSNDIVAQHDVLRVLGEAVGFNAQGKGD